MAPIVGGMAFLVLAGSLAGGPLASMTPPPSPPVLMLLVAMALALAEARRRLASSRRDAVPGPSVIPELRRRLVETENQRDRLSAEALEKKDFEVGFAGLVERIEEAERRHEKARRSNALRRLETIRLKSENRALRASIAQARVDLSLIRERIDRLSGGRVPTRLARLRGSLHAFRASPAVLESIRKLEALAPPAEGEVTEVTARIDERRQRRLISGQPSRWDRPRIPWRSPGSRAPASRCP